MSKKQPACIQCGGTDYVLESGFYFCSECQVQSQDIREEVCDDFWAGQRSGTVSVVAPPASTQDTTIQDPALHESITTTGKNLTSWEVLNIVLKGLVDELSMLGAPKELKLVVLQLWSSYLMKIEVAFISKHILKRPRLGLNFRKKDAELIYGANNDLIKIYKRPVFRAKRERLSSKSSNMSEKASSLANKRMERYRLTMKKKQLAKAEYEQASVSSQASEITLESLSERSVSTSSQKRLRLRYRKKAKGDLIQLLDDATEADNDARSSLQKKVLSREAKSAQHASMSTVLAILRLALLILGSDIHLGDILRWSDEGYLSLLNAEKLLPASAATGKDVISIFVSTLNSRPLINKNIMQVANLIGVYNISSRILPLIERYIKELQLPDDLLRIIKMFIELCPPKLKLTSSVNYEGRAMAFIIFTLKFLFGLDGVTEKRISKTAKIINQHIKSDEKKLFNWSEWVSYINCRNSVVSVYHQATRNVRHPTSTIGGAKPFLSHWDKVPAKQTLKRRDIISTNVKDCVRRFLSDFSQEPVEPFHPSLSPLSSILADLFDRDQHIPARAKKILGQDFQNDLVEYLYERVMQEEISKKYDINLVDVLATEIIQVKPVILEGNSSKPSLRGNKEVVDIKIDFSEGNSNKRKKHSVTSRRQKYPDLNMKKAFLPHPGEFLEGVKLKNKSESDEKETLYICGRRYWVYHGAFSNVRTRISVFKYMSEFIFPEDFLLILKEASLIAHICPRDLYTQLSYVEKMYLEYLTTKRKPRKFFVDHW